MSEGKKAVIAEIAADLGGAMALAGAAPEGVAAEDAAGDLFASLDDAAIAAGGAFKPPAKRGAGRPAGSPDRSTAELRRYLATKGYRDPLEFLASIYSADPRQLAADLAGHGDAEKVGQDLTTEAARLQVRAAESALPYLHRKMPLDVHHSGDGARPLMVFLDQGGGAAAPRGNDGSMSLLEDVRYQRGSASTPDAPQSAPPHKDGK